MSSNGNNSIRQVGLHDLLTPDQVATLTGLSKETLAQWRSQRRGIPYLKIGRAVRYDSADVQQYLAGCRVSVSKPNEPEKATRELRPPTLAFSELIFSVFPTTSKVAVGLLNTGKYVERGWIVGDCRG